ncbi:50S ribosomal protein L25 [Clostridium sp.]|uniref:50S ribosomal protein L25 n=1 Tax=Clostridium sp. TaxID=1506 RepID=UPI002611FFFD|nr:50S ribosomal protein L25 [Clostridium sp.]
MENLNLQKRDTNISNNAKKLRKIGKIPGVLYSKELNNLLFEVGELDIVREVRQNGEHGVINLSVNGDRVKALIKDVQRDPVTNKIIHLDLQELEHNQKVISQVPIHYLGEEFLHRKGMVLQKEKDTIKVECYSDNIPKSFKINMTQDDKESVYRISDLEVASELSIIDDLNSVIASSIYERKLVNNPGQESDEASNIE